MPTANTEGPCSDLKAPRVETFPMFRGSVGRSRCSLAAWLRETDPRSHRNIVLYWDPSAPSDGNGLSSAPSDGNGLSSAPSDGNGLSSAPSDDNGLSSAPSDGNGLLSAPSDGDDGTMARASEEGRHEGD